MINFTIIIEELPDTHVRIRFQSEHEHLCSKGELECFKKFYRLMNKEFLNIKPADIKSTEIGQG